MAYDIGQAYVEILPSAEKFGSTLKGELAGSTEAAGQEAGGKFASGLKNGLKVVGEITAAAVAAAGVAVGKIVSDSVAEYGQYEQLVGGVQKLFGEMDYQTVVDNASQAFKTAGISANEYMENVTSFSASLISSLSGDTEAAVEYADMAILDMSDNANTFGTDITSIQNAYQGFAKQNYTMLDNLKLGYGGTKSEMERLIADANAVKAANGEMADLSIESFGDVVEAIHIMQEQMNIAGTTAKEASTTIEGSVTSMKAAWHNLLVGLADDNQDFSKLVNDLVETIVGSTNEAGERVGGVINNILPRVQTALSGIAELIKVGVPELLQYVPPLIEGLLPDLVSAATALVQSFVGVLPDIIQVITDALPGVLSTIGDGLIASMSTLTDKIPDIADSLSQTLGEVLTWVSDNAGELISTFAEMLSTVLTSAIQVISDNKEEFVQALLAVIKAVVQAAVENPELVAAIIAMKTLPNIGESIISSIGTGLTAAKGTLTQTLKSVLTGASSGVDASGIGTSLGTQMSTATGTALSTGLSTAFTAIAGSGILLAGATAIYEAYKAYTDYLIESDPAWQSERANVEQTMESTNLLADGYDHLTEKVGGMQSAFQVVTGEMSAVDGQNRATFSYLEEHNGSWLDLAEHMGYSGNAAQGVAYNLEKMYGELYEAYEAEKSAAEGADGLGTSMDNAASAADSAIQAMGGSLDSLMTAWSQTFETEMPAALQIAISEANAAGIEIPQEITSGLLDGSLDVEDAITKIIDLFDKTSEASEYGVEDGSSFNDGLSSQIDGIEATAQDIADTVTSTIDPLPGEMNEAGSESGSNLDSAFGNWKGAISGTVDETYNFFYSTLGTMLPSMMNQWGSDSAQKFNSGLNIWMSDIQSTADNMSTGIQTALSPLPGQMESIGSQAGAGLYNGLSSWAGAIESQAWAIANSINAAARAALQINSPSKVMAKVGEGVGEGLALGIENSGELAVDATTDLSNELIDSAMDYNIDGRAEYRANSINDYMPQILTMLEQLSNLKVVMDTGQVVGVLAPGMSDEFQRMRARQGRG